MEGPPSPNTPDSTQSSGPISLRPATDEDLGRLADLETRLQVAPWTVDHFRTEIAKPYSNVCVLTDDETDTVIHGYIVFWLMPDACQVLNIAVDLPHRGLGLARLMLRRAIDQAMKQNIDKATLDVRKSNQPALQLYQSLNFTIDHIRKNFYSNGEDAYQLTLHIKEDVLHYF